MALIPGTMEGNMTVRSALIQATGSIDKDENIAKHLELIAEAAKQGAQITCLQELFFSPYFCQVQDAKWYGLVEPIPGPTTRLMQEVAQKHSMVLVVPLYEEEAPGIYYNTGVVIDADGTLLGKYRKTHIPHLPGFWEKFYFRPGNLGYPVFNTRYARVGVYICYDRHFPEGARALGLNGAEIVYMPSATSRGLSMHLWRIEQTAHAIANGYFVGTINRVGQEKELGSNDYYGSSYFCDPRGQIIAQASDREEEVLVADLDLDLVRQVRNEWQFYRDRRPDAYGDIVAP
jgi:beta-ureidopropionase